MNKIRDFRDLIVRQKAHQLFMGIVVDTETFPNKRAAQIISDQILRSSSSISANIAEGFGRRKGKEYLHYPYYCQRFDDRDFKLVDKMF